MQEHLKAEDFERYMDANDLSEEYLIWYEEVSEHLEKCVFCRKVLNRLLMVESVCEEDSLQAGFSLLQREEEIRSKLLAQHLILQGQQERLQAVIALLCAGQLQGVPVYRTDMLRKQSVARGGNAVQLDGTWVNLHTGGQQVRIRAEYADGRIKVKVVGDVHGDYTVILQPEQTAKMPAKQTGESTAQPLIGRAVWSASENAAITEIAAEALEEMYRIYIHME